MCLAIPGKIVKIEGKTAEIDYSGEKRTANTSLIEVNKGDYVIVNAGFIMEKLNKEQAEQAIKEWENAGREDERNR
ncbi:HypC/HybG/HupF family hydrogenase formation chaperone [Candidatus Woesearchaeota archaeon]|nr:HypC/HybG/HupF family hydrogenase formation chaperone [Candidatus Woesearchaeota archaeon]